MTHIVIYYFDLGKDIDHTISPQLSASPLYYIEIEGVYVFHLTKTKVRGVQFFQQIRVVSVHLKNRRGVGVILAFLVVDECNFHENIQECH